MSSPLNNGETAGAEEGSGGLDHALLESIFYSELLEMDDSTSLISSSLLSTLAADGSVRKPPMEASLPDWNEFEATLDDASSSSTYKAGIAPQQPAETAGDVGNSEDLQSRDCYVVGLPTDSLKKGNSTATAAIPDPLLPISIPKDYNATEDPTVSGIMNAEHVESEVNIQLSSTIPAPPTPSATTTRVGEPDAEKRQTLVSQFAALASRLGITLPATVVESLTRTPQVPDDPSTLGASKSAPSTLAVSKAAPSSVDTVASTVKSVAASYEAQQQQDSDGSRRGPGTAAVVADFANPAVRLIAEAANAAVEAASRKRSVNGGADHSENSDGGTTSAVTKQAPHSKRRKKPRLPDCEAKLAELQAENSMLKRHLANLSSQSQRLDQERLSQEARMRKMLEEGAAEAELDDEVKHFQEVYSDYGRRRHQEIHFHLDQLRRLANPTNFTKLGLWTMGQQSSNSRNPIAGILQKELNISNQQGKKILEQRKRIQEVCSNLKECLGLLAKLKTLCVEKTQIFHDRISKCREILTPRQVVKLIIWINENTEVLHSVCPGWGSENAIVSKTAKRGSAL